MPSTLSAAQADALARLKARLGPKGFSEDPADLAPRLVDWRGRYHGTTPLLVRPGSTAEVAAVVAVCAEAGLAITPQGGNTGMVGGATPQGELLLSTERLRTIRAVDIDNDSLVAEAGVLLASVQEAADNVGRQFPLTLGSEGSATVGGLVSTNAGGAHVLRFGMMRELTLGLEAVLPDGRIWDGLSGLRKDNTGYDLKQLFIGAEGTLGVVTAACLKLHPKPALRAVAFAGLSSPKAAVDLLGLVKVRAGDALTAFELVPKIALDLVLKHIPDTRAPLGAAHPWNVLIELSFFEPEGAVERAEAVLAAGLEAGLLNDAALAANETQAAAFWRLRETISEAERAHGKAVKHDVSVPTSAIPALMDEASAAAQNIAPGAEIIAFGHVGDGNVHFNVARPPAMAEEFFLSLQPKIHEAVHDVVGRMGGSISAEHGIGVLKKAELARRAAGPELDVMRAVKRALDPKGIMNPRVLFDVENGASG
jgi:FAD/FMN-containing dehydrogenase